MAFIFWLIFCTITLWYPMDFIQAWYNQYPHARKLCIIIACIWILVIFAAFLGFIETLNGLEVYDQDANTNPSLRHLYSPQHALRWDDQCTDAIGYYSNKGIQNKRKNSADTDNKSD